MASTRRLVVGAAVAIILASAILLCNAHHTADHHDHDHDVRKTFEEHRVVPDVVDVAPEYEVTVKYRSSSNNNTDDAAVSVHLGDELTPTQVKDAPAQIAWPIEPNTLYTLILTDPDASREWRHWTVVNIPGTNVASGDTQAEYVGAGPPPGSGLHRYVFVVYRQPGRIAIEEPVLSKRNPNRAAVNNTREFARKYALGNPVAGNLFRAQYDDYVPTLYAQFQ